MSGLSRSSDESDIPDQVDIRDELDIPPKSDIPDELDISGTGQNGHTGQADQDQLAPRPTGAQRREGIFAGFFWKFFRNFF